MPVELERREEKVGAGLIFFLFLNWFDVSFGNKIITSTTQWSMADGCSLHSLDLHWESSSFNPCRRMITTSKENSTSSPTSTTKFTSMDPSMTHPMKGTPIAIVLSSLGLCHLLTSFIKISENGSWQSSTQLHVSSLSKYLLARKTSPIELGQLCSQALSTPTLSSSTFQSEEAAKASQWH